jgi:aspartate racemase
VDRWTRGLGRGGGVEALQQAGCDLLAARCNTAHAFVPTLAAEAGMQLVSIVGVTAEMIAAGDARTVGLLATTGTVRSGLYADALAEQGVAVVTPQTGDQQLVMNARRTAGGSGYWAEWGLRQQSNSTPS